MNAPDGVSDLPCGFVYIRIELRTEMYMAHCSFFVGSEVFYTKNFFFFNINFSVSTFDIISIHLCANLLQLLPSCTPEACVVPVTTLQTSFLLSIVYASLPRSPGPTPVSVV